MIEGYGTRAGEAYQKARRDLLEAEIALKEQCETVAALRRDLPQGALVEQDYRFREGPADLSRNGAGDFFETSLSELFAPGQDRLILIHFMFKPGDAAACPMCSMWADGYDAVVPHVTQKAGFAVVAKAEIGSFRACAKSRGWHRLRLLSSYDTSFNRDFGMEDADGGQLPGVSVLGREADGRIRHFYSGSALMAPDQYRGVDLMSPVWHLFDLLPEGRGDWFPSNL